MASALAWSHLASPPKLIGRFSRRAQQCWGVYRSGEQSKRVSGLRLRARGKPTLSIPLAHARVRVERDARASEEKSRAGLFPNGEAAYYRTRETGRETCARRWSGPDVGRYRTGRRERIGVQGSTQASCAGHRRLHCKAAACGEGGEGMWGESGSVHTAPRLLQRVARTRPGWPVAAPTVRSVVEVGRRG